MNTEKESLEKGEEPLEAGNKRIIEVVKDFLLSNKILFETVATLFISIVGVLISCAANDISRAQKEILEKEAVPIIDLASEFDDEGNVTKVSIVNTGGLLGEFHVELYPYIRYQVMKRELLKEEEDKNWYSYTKIEGAYPIILKQADNDGIEEVDRKYRNMYITYAPHTKAGVLMEICDGDLTQELNYAISKIIKMNNYQSVPQENDVHEDDSEEAQYLITFISFEYLVRVEYSSVVSDNEIFEESYYVITGHMSPKYFLETERVYADSNRGVNRITKETWQSDLLRKIKENDISNLKYLLNDESADLADFLFEMIVESSNNKENRIAETESILVRLPKPAGTN